MNRSRLTGQRLMALFLLGGFLLNYPLLYLFDRNLVIGGIPLLPLYVFGVWGLLIAAMAWLVERRGE